MSNEPDYELISKKWYFWIPLVLMGMVFVASLVELLTYGNVNYVSFIIWLFLGVNTVLLVWSYSTIHRGVHIACGILMITIIMIYLYFLDGFSFYGFRDFWYLFLSVIAGLLLFIFSFFDYSDESDSSE